MKIHKYLLLFSLGLAALGLPVRGFAAKTIPVTDFTDVAPPGTPATGSLRAAISSASDGDTVTIPTATITLAAEIQILNSITIQGAGAATTIIDGNNNDRIFEIGNSTTNNS